MKKLLLISALAFGAASVSAASFTDYFTVSNEGKTIENGGSVINQNWDNDGNWYDSEIKIALKSPASNASVTIQGFFTDYPSVDVWNADNTLDGNKVWGLPQICEEGGACWPADYDFNFETFEMFYKNYCQKKTIEVNDNLIFKFHLASATGIEGGNEIIYRPQKPGIYEIYLTGNVGSSDLDGFNFYMVVGPDAQDIAAVDDVQVDNSNAPVVYYDLMGRRVVNPAKGQLVIERKGTKSVKKIF